MSTPTKKKRQSEKRTQKTVSPSTTTTIEQCEHHEKLNRDSKEKPRSQFKICKFLRGPVRAKYRALASSLVFDISERARVEAMNQYFKQFWLSMVHFHKSRNIRLLELEKKLPTISLEEEKNSFKQKHFANESRILRARRERMSTRDFMLLAVIGRGGFGEVYLARKCDTGEILALKKMPKKQFIQQNDLSKLKRERDVMMQSSNSPWLIDLRYSFQSENFIYLAMEFVPGGDMKNLLDHVGCFSEVNARFYFAEMLLAVQALHYIGYIHRDLKPDNFLVTRSGHIKLIDFGLSKDGLVQKYGDALTLKIATAKKNGRPSTGTQSNNNSINNDPAKRKTKQDRRGESKKAYSVVGSPEYMAIEILEEVGYNHTVDYWSLGIILYELFYGVTPFTSNNSDETFSKLTFWKDYIVPPEPMEDEEVISDYGWDLVVNLVCEPEKRIGNTYVDEIKQHPWFLYNINNKRKASDSEKQNPFDWDHIIEFEPPFVPQLDHELDTSYFSNALDEEDLAVLSQTAAGEILNADPNTISISLEAIDSSQQSAQPQQSTYFKNDFEHVAFAGWTFKHDGISALLDMADKKD